MAVKYSVGIFPFSNVVSKFICLLGSSDHFLEVREISKEGLLFPKQKKSEMNEADNSIPSFSSMIKYLDMQIKQRRTNPGVNSDPTIENPYIETFTQETFTNILHFLRLLLLINGDPDLILDPGMDGANIYLPQKVSQEIQKNQELNSLQIYTQFLESSLNVKYSSSLIQVAAESLLLLIDLGPKNIALEFCSKMSILEVHFLPF